MLDLIDIERAKNRRAMRHIAFIALAMFAAIITYALWKCSYIEVTDSLSHLLDIILSGLILVVIQFFKTEDNKAPIKRKQDIAAKNDIKYDFHVY